jgi:hypothetical protein
MFGHYDVAENRETVFLSGFFQNLEEQIFASFGSEKLLAVVTGASNPPFAPKPKNQKPASPQRGTHAVVRLRKIKTRI